LSVIDGLAFANAATLDAPFPLVSFPLASAA
jgi:hypothetical protein